ncbi:MAG TPA: WavE lipopolysaccharide synthesis family protein [Bryobacteraceae bacterium]|nr:WavE lipopolysaccharide synthesis family protein [Bryobacteraceae bacterium]
MIGTSEFSFVVQGAIDRAISPLTGLPITQSCLNSLRQYYPGAEVILSTWPDQDTSGLDFDILVLNEDPGAHNTFRPEAGEVKLDNTNRQILSSKNGLRQASRKYAVKLRSDMIFGGNNWLQYLNQFQARVPEWKVFRQRVITCSMWARDPRCPYSNFPLHPPDWIHIGLTEDIRLLWDIPLEPQPESAQWFLTRSIQHLPPLDSDLTRPDVDARRYYAEQYLWSTLLRKFGPVDFSERRAPTDEDIWLTELTFANNLIILDPDQFPFTNHKYPYPVTPGYRYYRFIAHKEWEALYLKYCAGKQTAALLKQITDLDYYLKRLYIATFTPLQKMREFAIARRS